MLTDFQNFFTAGKTLKSQVHLYSISHHQCVAELPQKVKSSAVKEF